MYTLLVTLLVIAWSGTQNVMGMLNDALPYMWWSHITAVVFTLILSVVLVTVATTSDKKKSDACGKTLGRALVHLFVTSPIFITSVTIADECMDGGLIFNNERMMLAVALYMGGILMQLVLATTNYKAG